MENQNQSPSSVSPASNADLTCGKQEEFNVIIRREFALRPFRSILISLAITAVLLWMALSQAWGV